MTKTATVREQLEETESALEMTCEQLRKAKKALQRMKERALTLEKGLLEAREGREEEQSVLIMMQDRCQAAHEQHLQDLSTVEQLADALRRIVDVEQKVDRSQQVTALLSSLPARPEALEGN